MQDIKCDILVVGGGPAGLSAAIYAGRSKYSTKIVCSLEGGQLTNTKEIFNYPGFKDNSSSLLIENFLKQVSDCGVEVINGTVSEIKEEGDKFIVLTKRKKIEAKILIYSLGSNVKMLDIPEIDKKISYGVYTCALCDGPIFKNKTVVVVGGGNKALEEAMLLSGIAEKVYIVHRSNKYKAEHKLQEKARNTKNIEFIEFTTIEAIESDKENGLLKNILLKNVISNETTSLVTDALFVAIGVTPNTTLIKNIVELEDSGHIKIKNNTETSKKGVYACGEASDNKYRQAITSAGQGAMCAIDSVRYLDAN